MLVIVGQIVHNRLRQRPFRLYSASQGHFLASHKEVLPCTDDESFLEVISVFENMKEVLDWPCWTERGGVEGGVGLTGIRGGE